MLIFFLFSLEIVVEPWIDGLLPALRSVFYPSLENSTKSELGMQSVDETVSTSASSVSEQVVDGNDLCVSVKASDSVMPGVAADTPETDLHKLSLNGSADRFTDFELLLRGGDDDSWQLNPFTVSSPSPSYIDLNLVAAVSFSTLILLFPIVIFFPNW